MTTTIENEIQYETKIENGKAIIVMHGDFDSEPAADALRKAFNDLFNRGERTIVLDLRAIEIISDYGLGKILECRRRLRAEEGTLMVKPLSGFVREVVELLMLDAVLPVDTDEGGDGDEEGDS